MIMYRIVVSPWFVWEVEADLAAAGPEIRHSTPTTNEEAPNRHRPSHAVTQPLKVIGREWEAALARLKALVETA
jgi:hypothetical protein